MVVNRSQEAPVELLRVEHVLDRLACSRRTLYRLVESGDLVPVYLDRRPRFLAADVRALVENRRGARSP